MILIEKLENLIYKEIHYHMKIHSYLFYMFERIKSLIYQFSKNFVFFLVPAYVEPQPTDGKFVVRKGSTITLSCRATGNPLPTVTWQRKVRKNWIKTQ